MQYDELKEHIKQAMKAHDKVRLSILRQVHGEVKDIEVNERREITEQDVDDMTKRVIKQTKETLEGSIKAGNNQERTDMLTDVVLSETGATTKKEMGRVMGELTKRTGGNFDKAAAAKELQGKLA